MSACNAGSLSPFKINSVWPSHSMILTARFAAKSSSSAPLRGMTCPNRHLVDAHLTMRHLISVPETLAASNSASPAASIVYSSSSRFLILSSWMKK